jgi:type III restriction enzyme
LTVPDEEGQPTNRPPVQGRRRSELITPVPKPRKRKRRALKQGEMVFAEALGLTDAGQEYNPTPDHQ